MKTLLFTKNINLLPKFIRAMNLKVERPWLGSGSVEALDRNEKIEGGAYLRAETGGARPVVGWIVAFGSKEIHLYVDPKFRGMGFGSRLIDYGAKTFPDHCFCPWNASSSKIFKHKNCKVTNLYLQ